MIKRTKENFFSKDIITDLVVIMAKPNNPATLEDIYSGEWQSITISPNTRLQYYDEETYSSRIVNCLTGCKTRLFKKLLHCAEFELYPEISFSGHSHKTAEYLPRIHFHGYIKVTNPADFVISKYQKLKDYSQFYIKPIDDEDEWIKYITKQSHIFKPLFEDCGVPYRIDNTSISKIKTPFEVEDYSTF